MAVILRDIAIAMFAYLDEIDFANRRPGVGEAEVFVTIIGHLTARQAEAASQEFFRLRKPNFQKNIAARPVLVTTTDEWREKLTKLGH